MSNNPYIIIGLGKTGLSCIDYLLKQNKKIIVMDTRLDPPGLTEFKQKYSGIPIYLGPVDKTKIANAAALVVSPGIGITELGLTAEDVSTIPVIGDIELFAQNAKAPIIAITGTNAKGTVTTLVGEMIAASGQKVLVGGNIGIPALDLLSENIPDYYVLEISSFQLETTYSLHAIAATILNFSEDHLDRHGTMQSYIAAKQRIYKNCKTAIYNRDDVNTLPATTTEQQINFGLSTPKPKEFGIQMINNENYLFYGKEQLINVKEIKIKGRHNWANALAALALGTAIHLPIESMLKILREFKGLTHRCEWVAEINGVTWFDDSKGTNVGATLAALDGLGAAISGKIILIAGGLGKGADFTPLKDPVAKYAKSVILIGKDAPLIEKVINGHVAIQHANSLQQAVEFAHVTANKDDIVLLSPACASWDMFRDYNDRGDQFKKLVRAYSKSR
jgi:UDP-N-acetylmuramoylalanine--D-glutamate ligase